MTRDFQKVRLARTTPVPRLYLACTSPIGDGQSARHAGLIQIVTEIDPPCGSHAYRIPCLPETTGADRNLPEPTGANSYRTCPGSSLLLCASAQVRLQESPEESTSEFYGRVPRTVDVELLDDLVDTCVPGDVVRVIGMVKSVEVSTDGGGYGRSASSKPKSMFLLYLEAVAVMNAQTTAVAALPNAPGAAVDDAAARINASVAFSTRDLREIASLHANWKGRMFELLAASFCPSIFGHEVVKVGPHPECYLMSPDRRRRALMSSEQPLVVPGAPRRALMRHR